MLRDSFARFRASGRNDWKASRAKLILISSVFSDLNGHGQGDTGLNPVALFFSGQASHNQRLKLCQSSVTLDSS